MPDVVSERRSRDELRGDGVVAHGPEVGAVAAPDVVGVAEGEELECALDDRRLREVVVGVDLGEDPPALLFGPPVEEGVAGGRSDFGHHPGPEPVGEGTYVVLPRAEHDLCFEAGSVEG